MSDRLTDEEEPLERPVINEEPEDVALAEELARLEDRASELEERARDLAGAEDKDEPAAPEPGFETGDDVEAAEDADLGEEPQDQVAEERPAEEAEAPLSDDALETNVAIPAEVEPAEEPAEEPTDTDLDAEPVVSEETVEAEAVELAEEPEAESEPEAAEAAFEWPEEEPERRGAISWPFWVYLGAWAVFAGVWTYLLWQTSIDGRLVEDPRYPTMIWSGIGVAAVGPMLSIIVWLVSRARVERGERRGLFARALLLGALVTLGGVALWWVGLLALDYARLGSL